ncbi:hypothetical protein MTO96_009889 [Rhipicephalus appendiculatus]
MDEAQAQAAPERVPAPGAELASRAAAAAKAKHGGHFRETRVPRRSACPSRGPERLPGAAAARTRLWRRGTSRRLPAVGAKIVARHERTLPIKPPGAAPRSAPPTAATLRAARRRNSNAPCAGDEELCVDFCAVARARTLRARALWSASQLRGNVPTSSDARVPLKWTKLRRRLPLPCVVCARASPRPSGGDVVRPVRLLVVFAADGRRRLGPLSVSCNGGVLRTGAPAGRRVPPAPLRYPQLATPRFYNAGYGDQAAAAADYANLAVDSSAFYPTLNPAYTMKEAADPWRGITQPASYYYDPALAAYGRIMDRVRDEHVENLPAQVARRTPPVRVEKTGTGGLDFNGARRKNVTRDSTSTLKAWLNEHRKNPYPTKGEKIMLAIITKMTLTQVSTWFANARRRLKKENKMTWEPRNKADADDSGAEDKKDDEDTMDERTASVQDPMRRSDSTRSYCSLSALQRSRESTLRPPQTSAEVDHEAAEMQPSHTHRANTASDLHQQRHNYGHSANPYALGGRVSVSNPQRHHVPGAAELAHGIHTGGILGQSITGPPRPRISHVQVVAERRGRLVGRRQRAQQAQDLVAG